MSRICHVLIAHIMYLFLLLFVFLQSIHQLGTKLATNLWRHLLKKPYAAVLVFRLLLSFDFVFFLLARHSQNKLRSALASYVVSTYFPWWNSSCLTNSCTGTSSAFAIAMRASRLGWVVLVTHLETVAGSLPSLSDNHLLFRSRSASTTLILFNFAMIEPFCLVQKYLKWMRQMQHCSKTTDLRKNIVGSINLLMQIYQNT